jgi:hypothetical protein
MQHPIAATTAVAGCTGAILTQAATLHFLYVTVVIVIWLMQQIPHAWVLTGTFLPASVINVSFREVQP